MFIPPSTWITCPDTYEDISEARKVATSATSSGVPPRRKGIFLAHSAFYFVRQFGCHIRDDESRSDGIGTDTARAQFLSDGFSQTDHTGF